MVIAVQVMTALQLQFHLTRQRVMALLQQPLSLQVVEPLA
jgi:hypothetical protein